MQVGGIGARASRHEPSGPAEAALLAEPGRRHLLALEDQVYVPDQHVALIVAHDRDEAMEAETARQQALVFGQRERAEHDAELVLPGPDAGAEQCGVSD